MAERLPQSIANEVIGNRSDETLQRLWGRLPLSDAAATRDLLLEVMPEITNAFGDVAATSSAAVYDSTMAAAGVSAPPAALPGPIAQEAIEAGVRWSVGPLFGANPDPEQALARMQQTTDRLAIAQSDATLRANSERDSIRYAWVPSGPTCAFCTRLASYGAVYKTPDINRHAKCNCSIQPVPTVADPVPVSTAGWKPTMTAQQATQWTAGSALTGPRYHGTMTGADSIRAGGFDDAHIGESTMNFGQYGKGHYMTSDPAYAQVYAGSGEVLEVRLLVTNPMPMAEFDALVAENGLTFSREGSTEIARLAQERGYDCIRYVPNPAFPDFDEIVVFDPKRIVTVVP